MLQYTFIYTLVFCVSLSFGIYALSFSPRNKTHQIFFMAAFCVSVISLMYIYSNNLHDHVHVWNIYKFGVAAYILVFYLLLLFIINLTGFRFPAGVQIFFSFFCLLTIIISILMPTMFELVKQDNVWKVRAFSISPWLYFLNSYVFIFFTVMIYILIRKLTATKLNREKRQFLVLTFSVSFCYVPFVFIWYMMKYSSPDTLWLVAPMPIFFLCFLAGCLYCIMNYRLFKLTPEFVSRDILANIADSVLLLDQNKKIITANKKTKMLTGYEYPEGLELKDILFVNSKVESEIDKLIQMETNDFSCRLNYGTTKGEKILVDVRFSTVKDKWNDILGILIIGKEVKELSQLKNIFRITDREAELIQFILSGRTNIEVAQKLSITENTVKRHISNIYNKFCCNNRMQLLAALKSYNIVPEQESERTVIIG